MEISGLKESVRIWLRSIEMGDLAKPNCIVLRGILFYDLIVCVFVCFFFFANFTIFLY